MSTTQISVSLIVGFGWSAESNPAPQPDGSHSLTFRYLPAGLWNANHGIVRAHINNAAKVFASFADFPVDLIPAEPTETAGELTDAGRAFYESCPLYGRFEAREPWMTWEQHRPNGEVAWQARGNNYDVFMDQVVSQWPINEWASLLLEPWKDLLSSSTSGEEQVLFMQGALPPRDAPDADEEGWSKGLDLPRADVQEKVQFPWGPGKVVLISCDEDRVKACRKMEFSEEFQLLLCSLAVRQTADAGFEWRQHHVWRFEIPLQLVPRMIKWTESEGVVHPGIWGVRSICPTYSWDTPQVKFQFQSEIAGWDTVAIIFKPLDSLDPVALARYEHDLTHMQRPRRA